MSAIARAAINDLLRLLVIVAVLWLGHLLVSNITDTYHDTRVVCEQVTHHSGDCR